MKKTKSRGKKSTRPRRTRDGTRPEKVERPPEPTTPADVHDARHPGGLPGLDAKTDWEAEHDTWWRHE